LARGVAEAEAPSKFILAHASLPLGEEILGVIATVSYPGGLTELAARISERGISVLSGTTITRPEKGEAEMFLLLDIAGSGLTAEQVIEELKALSGVSEVKEVMKGARGLVSDARAYMATSIASLFGWLDRIFGTGGHAILFSIGEQAAKKLAEMLKEVYGMKGQRLVETFLAMNVALGYFTYKIVKYDERKLEFVVRLFRNFECISFVGKMDKPMSHLVRGALAGVFNLAYGKEFIVLERLCVAKGDDCCEFVIEPKG